MTTVRWQDTPQGKSVGRIIEYLIDNFGGDVKNFKEREKWNSFYMQELDGASLGSKLSQEWVKSSQIPEDKYKNSLIDDESEEAEAIQMALTMQIMRTPFSKKEKEKIRRNVVSWIMAEYPPTVEGFDFKAFHKRDIEKKKKSLGKSYVEGKWQ